MEITQELQAILSKPGNQWTPEEKQVIANLVKNGHRDLLKRERERINA